MANIKKLLPQLNILSKYFQESDNYDISSYEDEKQLVVSVNNVSEDDKLKLFHRVICLCYFCESHRV